MIKGIQKTSLIDFPGQIACTLFTGGCNFRCGYCYNSDLVFCHNLPTIPLDKVLAFLNKRKNYLDGVCITGGEPTIHKDLPELCKKIKDLNLLVKLDTNGTNPDMVNSLIKENLVDYIAMDIKASKKNYPKVAGVKVDIDKLNKTIKIIMKTDHEFRTTVLPGIYNETEAENIGKWIKGAKRYFLQQFRAAPSCLDPKYRTAESVPPQKLETYKKIIQKYVPEVGIRGC